MKYLSFLLSFISTSIFGYQTQFTDSSFTINSVEIIEPAQDLAEIYFSDLNQDGFIDIIFRDYRFGVFFEDQLIRIHFIPGSRDGFLLNEKKVLITDNFIGAFFIDDWDGDGFQDLITAKSRFLEGGSMTNDVIEILYMEKTEVRDTVSFFAPYEIYNGQETNPKILHHIIDMDQDGKNDMVFLGFSHVTVGWNNGSDIPVFDEITNFGQNTYNAEFFDFNQDGYPDFLNDDQYLDEPVVHVNNKDRIFTRTKVGLPKSNPNIPESVYWEFNSFWFNDDPYPDLIIQKPDSNSNGGFYEIYIFDDSTQTYLATDTEFAGDQLGQLTPIHINNDGFTDFIQIDKNTATFWLNNQNLDFSPIELETELPHEIVSTPFYLDQDNDGDLDILFTIHNSKFLYQIISEENIQNATPSTPTVNTPFISDDLEVSLSWIPSNDDNSLNGHIKYFINILSAEDSLEFETHSTELAVNNLHVGDYQISIYAMDALLAKSGDSEPENFSIQRISNENRQDLPLSFILHQNYPNPFNPSTEISYQLGVDSFIKLKVFDAMGREVAVLVEGLKSVGNHSVTFDASALSSGIYFYQLEADGQLITKQLTLIK